MNRLQCKIVKIEVSGSMSLVTLQLGKDISLKAIVIETPATANYLVAGRKIHALFKDTEVVVGTGELLNISLLNRIPGTISAIDHGRLLCRLYINTGVGELQSVVGSDSVDNLGLGIASEVTAMVKLNEVMLEP